MSLRASFDAQDAAFAASKEHEHAEDKAEIRRHHRDFQRIRSVLDEYEAKPDKDTGKAALKAIRSIVGVLLLLALAACGGGSHWHGSGTVIGRSYDDPDQWYQPPIITPGSCTMIGKTESCSPGVNIPGQWYYDGPHWHLTVDDGVKHHEVEVDQSTYYSCRNGSTWNTETGCHPAN